MVTIPPLRQRMPPGPVPTSWSSRTTPYPRHPPAWRVPGSATVGSRGADAGPEAPTAPPSAGLPMEAGGVAPAPSPACPGNRWPRAWPGQHPDPRPPQAAGRATWSPARRPESPPAVGGAGSQTAAWCDSSAGGSRRRRARALHWTWAALGPRVGATSALAPGDCFWPPPESPGSGSQCARPSCRPPLQADDAALSALPCPAQRAFPLDQRRLQGRYGGGFAPPQGRRPNLPSGTGRQPQGLPTRLAPVAPPPGARTAFGLRAYGQGGHLGSHPQPRRLDRGSGGDAIALEIVPRDALQLGHMLRRTRGQGARHGRLVRTALTPTGALHGGIDCARDVTLGAGLRPPEDPPPPLAPLSDRAGLHPVLGHRDRCKPGGEDTPPAPRRAQGAPTGTPGRPGRRLAPRARLSARAIADRSSFEGGYALAGVRSLGCSSPSISPLLCAKNWQLGKLETAQTSLTRAKSSQVSTMANR
jgi:hypothetical protein